MPATGRRARRLSDQDLQRLLSLLKGADSTELKLTVPDSEQRSTVTALGMDPRWTTCRSSGRSTSSS